jgi:nitrogen regulatory protein P-II 2
MTIPTEKRMLITIVAEALIESRLVDSLKAVGVVGYSIGTCRGDSVGSVRASEWEGENIELKTLVSVALSERVLEMIRNDYLGKFAVVAYRSEVEVLRGDKFV